jgi:hypothetical protein
LRRRLFRRLIYSSSTFVGEQSDSLDKYQGLILADGEMDDEWTDTASAYLKPQGRQPIIRLAEFKGTTLEAFDDSPQSRGDRLFSLRLPSLPLQLPEGFRNGTRAMDLVPSATIFHFGHCYLLVLSLARFFLIDGFQLGDNLFRGNAFFNLRELLQIRRGEGTARRGVDFLSASTFSYSQ